MLVRMLMLMTVLNIPAVVAVAVIVVVVSVRGAARAHEEGPAAHSGDVVHVQDPYSIPRVALPLLVEVFRGAQSCEASAACTMTPKSVSGVYHPSSSHMGWRSAEASTQTTNNAYPVATLGPHIVPFLCQHIYVFLLLNNISPFCETGWPGDGTIHVNQDRVRTCTETRCKMYELAKMSAQIRIRSTISISVILVELGIPPHEQPAVLRALAHKAWQANLVRLPIDSIAAIIESRMKRCANSQDERCQASTHKGGPLPLSQSGSMGNGRDVVLGPWQRTLSVLWALFDLST